MRFLYSFFMVPKFLDSLLYETYKEQNIVEQCSSNEWTQIDDNLFELVSPIENIGEFVIVVGTDNTLKNMVGVYQYTRTKKECIIDTKAWCSLGLIDRLFTHVTFDQNQRYIEMLSSTKWNRTNEPYGSGSVYVSVSCQPTGLTILTAKVLKDQIQVLSKCVV